jgi:large subunit ribosomal protein L3
MSVTGILGKKIGMTQVFDEKGDVHPITVLQAGPCVITQLKTLRRMAMKPRRSARRVRQGIEGDQAMAGHFAKTNASGQGIREVGLEATPEGEASAKAGDRVLVDIFESEKFVDVIGTSKGRGFAGVVRRHGFGGGPKSHGHMFQVQGSIGASSFPSRVFPGQRMPGHMGATRSRCAICAFAASTLKRT